MLQFIRNRTKGGIISCFIGNIKFINKMAEEYSKEKFKEYNIEINPRHVDIFFTIGSKQIKFVDLQEKLKLPKSTLSDIINNYQKDKLIEKVNCPKDKRNIYISLTSQGKELINLLTIIDKEFKDKLFSSIPKERRNELEGILADLANNL